MAILGNARKRVNIMTEKKKFKKNDYLDVEFIDLTSEGMGVAKVDDGYTIFVEKALPGEKAKIRLEKVKKRYAYGRLVELYTKSPDRIDIPAHELPKYGGCQLQHMTYERQLAFKQNVVEQTLKRIGGLEDVFVHPIIGMDNPWYYRNKTMVPVGEKNGKLIAGFYRPRSHKIVDADDNVIHFKEINEAVRVVKETASRLGIEPYNETDHSGVLRHIMARYGRETGELMVGVITRTEDLPHEKELVDAIVSALPKVKSVVHNINPKRTNVILGEKTRVLWGRDVIYDYIGGIRFAISAHSFYQVNPVQTKVLYEKALEYAELTGEETVIDAYCGIGTISLFLAQKAKKVYGIEVVPEAIEDAKRNAKENGITNAEFLVGKAEEVIVDLAEQGIRADVVVVDPPRKGCDETLLQTVIEMRPKKFVYVSCNPATLARDLRILEDGGYRTIEVQPVDMFPQTTHVECVSQIVLREN